MNQLMEDEMTDPTMDTKSSSSRGGELGEDVVMRSEGRIGGEEKMLLLNCSRSPRVRRRTGKLIGRELGVLPSSGYSQAGRTAGGVEARSITWKNSCRPPGCPAWRRHRAAARPLYHCAVPRGRNTPKPAGTKYPSRHFLHVLCMRLAIVSETTHNP